jgi:hypothetical protein
MGFFKSEVRIDKYRKAAECAAILVGCVDLDGVDKVLSLNEGVILGNLMVN